MIVDPTTRDVIVDPDPAIFETARERAAPHRVVNEFLRTQIETNSTVCRSLAELAQSLRETRGAVIEAAHAHDARVIASSTHPWARWEAQQVTEKPRYRRAAATLQDTVRQFFIGGMHIHAGFATADIRIRVMDRLLEYLPLMLALSTSSPFHAGRLTGLKSYRQTAVAALPRTGLPPAMRSEAKPTTSGLSRFTGESGRSRTVASFAGTFVLPPPTPPSSFGSATSAPASRTRSRLPRSMRASSGRSRTRSRKGGSGRASRARSSTRAGGSHNATERSPFCPSTGAKRRGPSPRSRRNSSRGCQRMHAHSTVRRRSST